MCMHMYWLAARTNKQPETKMPGVAATKSEALPSGWVSKERAAPNPNHPLLPTS